MQQEWFVQKCKYKLAYASISFIKNVISYTIYYKLYETIIKKAGHTLHYMNSSFLERDNVDNSVLN